MLFALARDPIPSPVREWALALWAERVENQQHAQIAVLDAAAEDADRALSALAALKNVLDGSATYGMGWSRERRHRAGATPAGAMADPPAGVTPGPTSIGLASATWTSRWT